MRILCLHGFGNNPEIMKRKIAPIMQYCDPTGSWELSYLQGNTECPPAPGSSKYPGPYFCWSRDFSHSTMRLAHDLVHKTFIEQGPFDGVLGFSQGASVLLEYLLEQVTKSPNKPPPIKFARFCSPVAPLAADIEYCKFIFGNLSPEDESRLRSKKDDQIDLLPEPARTAMASIVGVIDEMEMVNRRSRDWFLDRDPVNVPCGLRPELYKPRLQIPTLHVRSEGEPDVLNRCANLIESFCEPRGRRVFQHTAGHSFPRREEERKDFAAAIRDIAASNLKSKL